MGRAALGGLLLLTAVLEGFLFQPGDGFARAAGRASGSRLDDPSAGEDPDALWSEAEAAMGRSKLEEADTLLRRYLALKPDNAGCLLELARVASWRSRYDESLGWYDKYLAGSPDDLDAMVEKALVLTWKESFAEAETLARQVLVIEPENVDANLLLARILTWQGKTAEADKVYEWILQLDPKNEEAVDARSSLPVAAGPGTSGPIPPAGTGTGAAPVEKRKKELRWDSDYLQDSRDFWMVRTRLGIRFPVGRVFALRPFVAGAAMGGLDKDGEKMTLFGLGGGLGADVQLGKRALLEGAASALYYFNADNLVDWGVNLQLGVTPVDGLWFALKFDTFEYGTLGQSPRAMRARARAYQGGLSLYGEKGRFSVFLDLSVTGLPGLSTLTGAEFTDVVLTIGANPMLRLAGKDCTLSLGYKYWSTDHSHRENLKYGYWAPDQYYVHLLGLRLNGRVKDKATLYLEAYGGFGHEKTWARKDDEAHWVFFPAVSGALGFEVTPKEDFRFGLAAWTIYTSREGDWYLLWNVGMHLLYLF
jgi:tetratricopeptide (TPR) repeat protein